jgi:nicotinamidase-related amidase
MSELILEPRRTAVVVIDLQKGIVGFPGNPHSASSVIANSVALLDAARSTGAQPILVHVGRSPDGGDGLQVACDEPMRMSGALPPDWSELIPELNRQPNDLVILKRQWGAFYGTDLELQLRPIDA